MNLILLRYNIVCTKFENCNQKPEAYNLHPVSFDIAISLQYNFVKFIL